MCCCSYLVVYEDSDREEMEWQDVMDHNPQWVEGGWWVACCCAQDA